MKKFLLPFLLIVFLAISVFASKFLFPAKYELEAPVISLPTTGDPFVDPKLLLAAVYQSFSPPPYDFEECNFTVGLGRVTRHRCVGELQQFLTDQGYNLGAIDSIFGGQTDAAVRAFQSNNPPLVVDGRPGAKTFEFIRNLLGEGPPPPSSILLGQDCGLVISSPAPGQLVSNEEINIEGYVQGCGWNPNLEGYGDIGTAQLFHGIANPIVLSGKQPFSTTAANWLALALNGKPVLFEFQLLLDIKALQYKSGTYILFENAAISPEPVLRSLLPVKIEAAISETCSDLPSGTKPVEVTLSASSPASVDTINPGDDDVPLAVFEFKANCDLRISSVQFNTEISNGDQPLQHFKIYDQEGNFLGSAIRGLHFFIPGGINLPTGQAMELTVDGKISLNIDPDAMSITMFVIVDEIKARQIPTLIPITIPGPGTGVISHPMEIIAPTTSSGGGNGISSSCSDLPSGTAALELTLDPGSPGTVSTVAGATNIELAHFRFEANCPLKIDSLNFVLKYIGNSSGVVTSIVRIFEGGNLLGITALSPNIFFLPNDLKQPMSAGDIRRFIVTSPVISSGAVTGTQFAIEVSEVDAVSLPDENFVMVSGVPTTSGTVTIGEGTPSSSPPSSSY